jgi:hypothetical protein
VRITSIAPSLFRALGRKRVREIDLSTKEASTFIRMTVITATVRTQPRSGATLTA